MKNKLSISLSVLLHIIVIGFLFLNIERKETIHISAPEVDIKETIEAVAINETDLKKEIQRIQDLETAKVEKALKEKRALEAQEKALQVKRKKEEQKLQAMAKERERLAKEAELAKQEKAVQLKKQQEELARIKVEKAKALKEQQLAEEKAKEIEALAEKKRQEAKKAQEALAKQREQEELKKKEALAKQKALEEQKRQQALAKEEQMRQRKIALAQKRALLKTEIGEYAVLIKAKIQQNWRQPVGIDFNGMEVGVRVRTLPTGEVVDVVIEQSSGNIELDRSTELAIRKASPLPMPPSQEAVDMFRNFTFNFEPEAV